MYTKQIDVWLKYKNYNSLKSDNKETLWSSELPFLILLNKIIVHFFNFYQNIKLFHFYHVLQHTSLVVLLQAKILKKNKLNK